MNITFLIGNGFDINLGLKTRYTDFYPYYLAKGHDDIISKEIADNYSRWADLELSLGNMLSKVPPEKISTFLDSKATLEADLADYLRMEVKNFNISNPDVQAVFEKNIVEFYKEFSTRDKNAYVQWQKQVAQTIHYQFITFNYTNALDELVEQAKQNKKLAFHSRQNTTYTDSVGEILHIHGTLSDDLILGLDNAMQINNPALLKSVDLTNYILKATINDALGEGKTERAKQLIDASDYVCVYGMSLGDTDLMWWKYLLEWLNTSASRRLVLFVYEKVSANPSGPEKLRLKDKWRSLFFRRTLAKPEAQDKLRSQIIVIIRSKIFDLLEVESNSAQIKKELVKV